VDYLIKKVYMIRAMKYAVILIASVPMLILYPFVSKYFTQGVMVGSVKG
jgi:putative aldouronate transport system permease protein